MEASNSAASHGLEAEARHATVMKCDLVGSTRIKRQLDLGAQLDFQRGCERFISTIAARYGAHVERFEGDGAYVVFGYPAPREDAAEAAVRMALDLVGLVGAARIVPGVTLHFRVGIASGVIAVMKQAATARGELTAGMTIDLAERLRALADPDQVVISDETRRLAGGFFDYQDLSSVSVKGFDEGVRAWRVTAPSGLTSRFEAQRFDPSRRQIVGRQDALAQLAGAWAAVRAGTGRAVCLMGEPGIGKSRLARAAAEAAAADGGVTLKIQCTPSAENTPLYPVAVMLREAAEAEAAAAPSGPAAMPPPGMAARARALLARLLPPAEREAALALLAPLFGLTGMAPPDLPAADLLHETIATLRRMLAALAAERPLLLLCEDLHWADHTTALMLTQLAADIAAQTLLLIVTTRPSGEQAAAADLAGYATIELQPLGPEEAAALVRAVAQDAPLPEAEVRRIVDCAEGVPLVIEEVTRGAIEAGARPDETPPAPAADPGVPSSLQLIIQARLARWPGYALAVQSASVLGRDFSLGLLRRLTGAAAADLAGMVPVLARDGLLAAPDAADADRVRFKHAMICQAVYNTLLSGDRRRLHAAAADALLRDHAVTPSVAPDVIADHLRKAGRYAEAIRLRLAESVRTAALGAYVETEGHCLAGLVLVDALDDAAERTTLAFRLLIQLGVARTGQHGYSAPQVEDAYRRAQAACGDSASAEMLYPIMRGLATLNLLRANLATAYELSVQGLRLAEQSRRTEFRIDALSVLCYTSLYYRGLTECRSFIEQCLALYCAEDGARLTYPVPQDAATGAYALLPQVLWAQGDPHGAEAAMTAGIAHVQRLGRDFDTALLHSFFAVARYHQRRFQMAIDHARTAVAIAEKQGYRQWYGSGMVMALLAQAALQPDPAAIRQAFEISREYQREMGSVNAAAFVWCVARARARAGDVAGARAMLQQALPQAEAAEGARTVIGEILVLLSELTDDDATAVRLLHQAHDVAVAHGMTATALRATGLIALRVATHPQARHAARHALDALDGHAPMPPERDWMHAHYAALRRLPADAQPAA